MVVFANDTEEYNDVNMEDIDLEYDFWDAKNISTVNNIGIDVGIGDFKEYTILIKTLLENYYLEETIKVVKKNNV